MHKGPTYNPDKRILQAYWAWHEHSCDLYTITGNLTQVAKKLQRSYDCPAHAKPNPGQALPKAVSIESGQQPDNICILVDPHSHPVIWSLSVYSSPLTGQSLLLGYTLLHLTGDSSSQPRADNYSPTGSASPNKTVCRADREKKTVLVWTADSILRILVVCLANIYMQSGRPGSQPATQLHKIIKMYPEVLRKRITPTNRRGINKLLRHHIWKEIWFYHETVHHVPLTTSISETFIDALMCVLWA